MATVLPVWFEFQLAPDVLDNPQSPTWYVPVDKPEKTTLELMGIRVPAGTVIVVNPPFITIVDEPEGRKHVAKNRSLPPTVEPMILVLSTRILLPKVMVTVTVGARKAIEVVTVLLPMPEAKAKPSTPLGPVGPWTPWKPWIPVIPCGPIGPVSP
jgi:hypothetical protein